MNQRPGGFFMGQPSAFIAHATLRDFQNPVALGRIDPPRTIALAQSASPSPAPASSGNDPLGLPIDVAHEWADKIDGYMKQVQDIQDYVKAHPSEATTSGLVKDAAALPPSGDLAAWPKMKALYDKLRAGQDVTELELDIVPALGVALISANQKMAALQTSLLTPTNIGIGAGILALAVGLVVLS